MTRDTIERILAVTLLVGITSVVVLRSGLGRERAFLQC